MPRKGEDARPGPMVRGDAVSGDRKRKFKEIFKQRGLSAPQAGKLPDGIQKV